MIYVVTFKTQRGFFDRSAEDFYTELQRPPLTRAYFKYSDEGWFIVTNENADQLFARLFTHMLTNDRLLIVPLSYETSQNYRGFLLQTAWDWLNAQIRAGALGYQYQ